MRIQAGALFILFITALVQGAALASPRADSGALDCRVVPPPCEHGDTIKDEPWACIAAIQVTGGQIYFGREPRKVTILVDLCHGNLQKLADPKATISVATYSALPFANKVHYSDEQSRRLSGVRTRFEFVVESSNGTVDGEITFQAHLGRVSTGMRFLDPEKWQNARTSISTYGP